MKKNRKSNHPRTFVFENLGQLLHEFQKLVILGLNAVVGTQVRALPA